MALSKLIFSFSVFILALDAKSIPKNAGEPFELNEFFAGTFSTRTFNGTWLTEDSFLHRSSTGEFVLYSMVTKNSTLFLPSTFLSGYSGPSISISPDQNYVLIRYNVSAVFRHSTTALYAVYDIENEVYYDIHDKNAMQIAQWTPQGHGLVYVYLNNIYYVEDPSAEPRAITTEGIDGVIYYGVPDWVYEEEVLGSGTAFWFSPNGRQIAYASFNDTEVKEFFYFLYGNPADEDDEYPSYINNQYPTEVKIRYPKVNEKNPDVKIYIADLDTDEEPVEVEAIHSEWYDTEDYVLYDIVWVTDDEIAVLYTNRVQNKARLVRCMSDGVCDPEPEAIYEEDEGWLEPHIPLYNKAGTQKIEIAPQPEEDDYFDHILFTDIENNTTKRLTQGPYYVLSIYGWDEDNDLVYFLGTYNNTPSQRHVYAVNTETLALKCFTCDMSTSRGVCKYSAASFSKDFSYIAKICQGPGPYVVEVQSTTDDSDVILWEDNPLLVARLSVKALPEILDIKVPIDNGRFQANVRLLLPPNLDESKKYPAVVYVYAGPNSNQISDSYSSGFQNYIVTNREYIYIYIDGRGSGRDGQNKMFQLYRNLATVEIEDQIAVTKYLQETYPYIDRNNTGIWGWSYGGFAAAWALVQDTENIFRFGLSVAPVTSFIYYDSIYTERYMGLATPEDNLGGYNNTDVTRNVEYMRGKLFFLIHGNADDNVHYQQAMLLSKALQHADIQFRQQSYPDENHGLGGVYPHLYHTIDRFWAQSFNKELPI